MESVPSYAIGSARHGAGTARSFSQSSSRISIHERRLLSATSSHDPRWANQFTSFNLVYSRECPLLHELITLRALHPYVRSNTWYAKVHN